MASVYEDIKQKKETVWINSDRNEVCSGGLLAGQKTLEINVAQNRLLRFMPFIALAFPETAEKKGIIESELLRAPALAEWCRSLGAGLQGQVYIKDDAHLPIAGSVKARGGIHEVLFHAEKLAQGAGMLKIGDDYSVFASDRFKDFFSHYTIQVGSTGNLGLSIGIMSAVFGFNVIVHMSRDAREWKKKLLRDKGVVVKEYDGNYSEAVAEGRRLSEADPMSIFVDDENSRELYFGYSTAALRLKVQLYKAGITVDEEHPLFVYLPCGVGGAPGGITFGLKYLFGEYVHCFFAEPVGAPCFTLGMATKKYNDISIYDIGLDGRTIADGLAVGRASSFVCDTMKDLVSGSFTVTDEAMEDYCKAVKETEKVILEPSACAGVHGIMHLQDTEEFRQYISDNNLEDCMVNSTHIIWATGGGLLPQE